MGSGKVFRDFHVAFSVSSFRRVLYFFKTCFSVANMIRQVDEKIWIPFHHTTFFRVGALKVYVENWYNMWLKRGRHKITWALWCCTWCQKSIKDKFRSISGYPKSPKMTSGRIRRLDGDTRAYTWWEKKTDSLPRGRDFPRTCKRWKSLMTISYMLVYEPAFSK